MVSVPLKWQVLPCWGIVGSFLTGHEFLAGISYLCIFPPVPSCLCLWKSAPWRCFLQPQRGSLKEFIQNQKSSRYLFTAMLMEGLDGSDVVHAALCHSRTFFLMAGVGRNVLRTIRNNQGNKGTERSKAQQWWPPEASLAWHSQVLLVLLEFGPRSLFLQSHTGLMWSCTSNKLIIYTDIFFKAATAAVFKPLL